MVPQGKIIAEFSLFRFQLGSKWNDIHQVRQPHLQEISYRGCQLPSAFQTVNRRSSPPESQLLAGKEISEHN